MGKKPKQINCLSVVDKQHLSLNIYCILEDTYRDPSWTLLKHTNWIFLICSKLWVICLDSSVGGFFSRKESKTTNKAELWTNIGGRLIHQLFAYCVSYTDRFIQFSYKDKTAIRRETLLREAVQKTFLQEMASAGRTCR